MMNLCSELITLLEGFTLATAESCTGGMIGAALTAVSGSSKVYKGGVISYTNEVKQKLLNVPGALLEKEGAVSGPVAEAMAQGVRELLGTDYAVSVTGLAGPGGDEYGNPVGTVYIGYADRNKAYSKACYFTGDREEIRDQAATAVLMMLRSEL